jgi:hypothetical protein
MNTGLFEIGHNRDCRSPSVMATRYHRPTLPHPAADVRLLHAVTVLTCHLAVLIYIMKRSLTAFATA